MKVTNSICGLVMVAAALAGGGTVSADVNCATKTLLPSYECLTGETAKVTVCDLSEGLTLDHGDLHMKVECLDSQLKVIASESSDIRFNSLDPPSPARNSGGRLRRDRFL